MSSEKSIIVFEPPTFPVAPTQFADPEPETGAFMLASDFTTILNQAIANDRRNRRREVLARTAPLRRALVMATRRTTQKTGKPAKVATARLKTNELTKVVVQRRLADMVRRPTVVMLPSVLAGVSAQTHARVAIESGRRAEDMRPMAFFQTAWDKPFEALMAGSFYRDTVRPAVFERMDSCKWTPAFTKRFMLFCEAGVYYRDFVQLHLYGADEIEHNRVAFTLGQCSACGLQEYATGAVYTAEQKQAQGRMQRSTWRICCGCFDAFDAITQTFSALWAVSRPMGKWVNQGYVIYATPTFPYGSTSRADTDPVCDAILRLLRYGADSPIWSQSFFPGTAPPLPQKVN